MTAYYFRLKNDTMLHIVNADSLEAAKQILARKSGYDIRAFVQVTK